MNLHTERAVAPAKVRAINARATWFWVLMAFLLAAEGGAFLAVSTKPFEARKADQPTAVWSCLDGAHCPQRAPSDDR